MRNIEDSLFDSFSKLSYQERINKLLLAGILNHEDVSLLLSDYKLPLSLKEYFLQKNFYLNEVMDNFP